MKGFYQGKCSFFILYRGVLPQMVWDVFQRYVCVCEWLRCVWLWCVTTLVCLHGFSLDLFVGREVGWEEEEEEELLEGRARGTGEREGEICLRLRAVYVVCIFIWSVTTFCTLLMTDLTIVCMCTHYMNILFGICKSLFFFIICTELALTLAQFAKVIGLTLAAVSPHTTQWPSACWELVVYPVFF